MDSQLLIAHAHGDFSATSEDPNAALAVSRCFEDLECIALSKHSTSHFVRVLCSRFASNSMDSTLPYFES